MIFASLQNLREKAVASFQCCFWPIWWRLCAFVGSHEYREAKRLAGRNMLDTETRELSHNRDEMKAGQILRRSQGDVFRNVKNHCWILCCKLLVMADSWKSMRWVELYWWFSRCRFIRKSRNLFALSYATYTLALADGIQDNQVIQPIVFWKRPLSWRGTGLRGWPFESWFIMIGSYLESAECCFVIGLDSLWLLFGIVSLSGSSWSGWEIIHHPNIIYWLLKYDSVS